MLKLNCLEPLASIGCGLAFIDGGITAAAVGATVLFTRFRENSAKHGLDDGSGLVAKVQQGILRKMDRWDATAADRDAVTLADAAMTRFLPQVMLSRDELAESSISLERYPLHAATLVVNALATHDPIFALGPDPDAPIAIPRRFALDVLQTALEQAMDDKDYAILLTLHLVKAGNRAHAQTHEKVDALAAEVRAEAERSAAFRELLLAEVRGEARQKGVGETALLALARRVVANVSDPDTAVAELNRALDEFILLRDRAERGSNLGDLVDETFRRIAALNEQGRLDEGAAAGARAFAALLEQEDALKAAKLSLIDANIEQNRLRYDAEAMAHWVCERIGTERGSLTALALFPEIKRLRSRSLTNGVKLDMDLAIVLAERSIAICAAGPEWATAQVWLGMVTSDQGERTGGTESIALLARAVAAYENALTVRTRQEVPDEWASITNNLANVLETQGQRTGGPKGLALLARAVAAHEDARSVYTKEDMPVEWAMSTNNLAGTLITQGKRTGGEEGIALLSRAASALDDALTVRTRQDMPVEWSMSTNNLGIALQNQGQRTGGAEGIALLARAVSAYENALTLRPRLTMPADWASTTNNLANALQSQGNRTDGAEGIALLARAIIAYEDALSVYTKKEMPAHWATSTNNLAAALASQGERIGGVEGVALLARAVATYDDALSVRTRQDMPVHWAMTRENMALAYEAMAEDETPLDHLRAAEQALLDALTIYTPEHMSYDYGTASASLTRIRAKIAALEP